MSGTKENVSRNTDKNVPRDALDNETARARANDHEEMRQWAISLKINKLIPMDLLPILAKDNAKQMEIVMKNMNLEERK